MTPPARILRCPCEVVAAPVKRKPVKARKYWYRTKLAIVPGFSARESPGVRSLL